MGKVMTVSYRFHIRSLVMQDAVDFVIADAPFGQQVSNQGTHRCPSVLSRKLSDGENEALTLPVWRNTVSGEPKYFRAYTGIDSYAYPRKLANGPLQASQVNDNHCSSLSSLLIRATTYMCILGRTKSL